jgi:hypothetical protein
LWHSNQKRSTCRRTDHRPLVCYQHSNVLELRCAIGVYKYAFRVCQLKDPALGEIEQKDLAVAIFVPRDSPSRDFLQIQKRRIARRR